ncbi:MAG: dTMP kinase [Christensenellales bacterium]|jgi:dTMP kinase
MHNLQGTKRTVIFDFDGTLMDTGQGVFDTLRIVFDEYQVDCSEEAMKTFIGPPLFESIGSFCGFDDEKTMEMVSSYRRHYTEFGLSGYSIYTGITQLLERLRAGGARLYVATNKPRETAQKMLESSGLIRFFEGVYGAGMNDRRSIKTENILKILQIAGAQNAIMVGDRKGDVEAAHEAGIPCVYAGWGFGSKEESEAAGSEYFAQTVREAAAALGVLGLFITYEGGDGAGKTTQINMLEKYLSQRGESVIKTFEPGGCPISDKIREILLDNSNSDMEPVAEALLYAAARAQHVRQVIRPALEQGKVVICDRYVDSSLAYQGHGRGLGREFVLEVNKRAVDGVMPHRTYLFHADPRRLEGRRKKNSDRIEGEGYDFKERVEQGFLKIKEDCPQRVLVLDATCPSRDIFDIIKDDLDRFLFD